VNGSAAWQRADALIELGRHDQAADVLREAIALAGRGKAKRAVGAAEEAVRLAPEAASAHEVLADARLAVGDHRGAREAAERSRELDPSAPGPHTLGDVALAQDRFGESEEHYRRALELDPSNHDTLNNLGITMLRWGRETQARELFERAAQADPRDPVARASSPRRPRCCSPTSTGGTGSS